MNLALCVMAAMLGILAGLVTALFQALSRANRRIDSLKAEDRRLEKYLLLTTETAARARDSIIGIEAVVAARDPWGQAIRDHDRLLVSIGRQLNRIEEGAAFRLDSAEHRLDAVDLWLGSQPDREVVAALLRSAADELDPPDERESIGAVAFDSKAACNQSAPINLRWASNSRLIPE